jgi:uncharacterized protein (DUF885 family)
MTASPTIDQLAGDVLDELLERHPDFATTLGEHRFDDCLPDLSPAGAEQEARWVDGCLTALDTLDEPSMTVDERVDAAILRNRLEANRFAVTEMRDHEWDPLVANPGTAIYTLLVRDFAPLGDRLRSTVGRLRAVPASLETARRTLHDMPRVHVETAVGQFTGTRTLLATELERALAGEPLLRSEVEPAREAAVESLDVHIAWLRGNLEGANGDPRLGAERFSRKLSLTLDTSTAADGVLSRAEADLARVEEAIAETAARLDPGGDPEGQVRRVLDRLAAEGHVDNDTIVELCRRAMAECTDFVRSQQLVSVPDAAVEIIVMPEIHRGVAVAYCDPPGPLEPAPLPTYFAVSPTPEDWSAQRVASFFREYNAHMLANLTVHEAMPGHVLQLAHSARFQSALPLRKALWSGSFVEGWAVYAEELMVAQGFRSDAGRGDALRMQQLKMQLRMTINAILDARVHARGMTEEEAMTLMTVRGHQEEGEAAGKWRRALLTSGQLSTYYVGYLEVAALARDLAAAAPDKSMRQRHDLMLSHGSPPPRHLRTLLGLTP